MGSSVDWLDAKLYPDFQHRWDDQLFRERILAHLGDGDLDVLDLGARGSGVSSRPGTSRTVGRCLCSPFAAWFPGGAT